MRILYVDIDTLRADHLGCYGYHRATSPNIDALAAGAIRFENCHASDVPCLPSRTALITGTFGTRNGVVSHGGIAGDLRLEGKGRGFQSSWAARSWVTRLRRAGLHTVTVSSFAERHSAWHWHMGFMETRNPGMLGLESAERVTPLALDWLTANAERDDWFLHVHLWDPHTPYRAPAELGEPFSGDPIPAWLTEEVRAEHWDRPGPHSAQELMGFALDQWGMGAAFPRQPLQAGSMDAVRAVFDGYDAGILHADDHVGRLCNALADAGVLDETAVMVSADHGENFGELGYYCDHHTADQPTTHVPMILRWPGLDPAVNTGLHYQIDVAATVVDLVGGRTSSAWDGRSLGPSPGEAPGRDHLVLTQGAWSAQRGVRWGDALYLHTRHDGFHGWPAEMLFDLAADPHQQHDLLDRAPELAGAGRHLLEDWLRDQLSEGAVDPLDTVMDEGGPWHVRGHLDSYLERLRATGRGAWADRLVERQIPVEARV